MTDIEHRTSTANKPAKTGGLGLQTPLRKVTTTLRGKGGLTIPQQVRDALHLEEGDQMLVSVRDGNIVLTPAAVVPRDQEWFWTPEWQAKEAEADADLIAGRVTRFDSDENFIKALGDRA